ncbi:MAG: Ig-like domain-containing protein, partial [Prochlorotrichaceae cyanobacterium]
MSVLVLQLLLLDQYLNRPKDFLSGVAVSIGTAIAAADIANLVYTSNADFGGVDSFQVTASDGTYDSAPADVDVFVNAPEGIEATLLRTFDFNSADGLTFNPTTGTIFASDSYRQVANNPNTVVWALREINATTGAEIRAVAESEDDLLGAAVLNVDIDPNTVDEGIQGMAVVQGTGTSRDGNVLLLSTRAAKIIEIDYRTGAQVTAANGGFEFVNPFIFSSVPPSSVTGIYHSIVNGEEVLWAVDFRGRSIVQFAKDGTLNQAASINLFDEIPDAELQGIVIDPATGNFLLADDATGNASNIYEVTPEGKLISTINLLQLSGGDGRFADTEGLGINPLTGELYVAIDDDLRNPNFNITEIGDQIAVLKIPVAPRLSSIDKYGDAEAAISFALTDFTAKLVDVAVFPGPAFQDADGDALASLTIVSLPTNGTLTLSGVAVSIGTAIAAADIA